MNARLLLKLVPVAAVAAVVVGLTAFAAPRSDAAVSGVSASASSFAGSLVIIVSQAYSVNGIHTSLL